MFFNYIVQLMYVIKSVVVLLNNIYLMAGAYNPIYEVWWIKWILKAWCWNWITILAGVTTICTSMTYSSAFDCSKICGSSITHNTRGFKSVQLKQLDCFKNTSYSKFALTLLLEVKYGPTISNLDVKSLHKNCKT